MNLLLVGGRLPGSRVLVDVLIQDGRIAFVGPACGVPSTSAERVGLDGRWLVPGLWDQHVHFTQWAQTARRFDVFRAASAAEAAELVRAQAVADPGDDVLVGFGFHDALWPDLPTRALLDGAAGERPVVLIAGDLHSSWLNTAAARRFAPGTTDAVLRENASFAVTSRLTAADDSTLDRWAADAAAVAASRGVVGIVDFEYGGNAETWTRRIAAGARGVRVEFGIYADDLERAVDAGMRTGQVVADTDGLVTVGPFKIISDGSLNTRTALCSQAYPDGGHGAANLTEAELEAAMRVAVAQGFEPAIHAIGDEANRRALDVFERVGARGRIEHAQLVHSADIARFARLGVTASVQPEHAMDDRDVADRLWERRTDRAFPLADFLRQGVRLAFGSDAPVAPLDPWVAISAATARSRDGRPPWHPEQCISFPAALAASTRNRIAVGEPADIVALDSDPSTAESETLRTLPVGATLLGGRFTYDALR